MIYDRVEFTKIQIFKPFYPVILQTNHKSFKLERNVIFYYLS